MIRREEANAIWLIHQAAHAFISGQIADHWVGNGTMTLSPREELITAAYNHDAGWAEYEQQPRVNALGMPRTFTEMDMDEHFLIWEQSFRRVFVQNRYAALLTVLHSMALYEQRLRYLGDPPEIRAAVQAFVDQWQRWADDMIARLADHPRYSPGTQPDQLAHNVRLLQVWDYLSLMLCISTVHEQILEDVPMGDSTRGMVAIAANGPRSMVLDPFPLDRPLTLWLDARRLRGGPFNTDDELRHVLVGLPYKPLVFEITPN